MGYQLGVDLGTTYSAAAVRRGDAVTMLGLGNRAMQIPSVLYLAPEGTFLVGEAAEARSAAEPDRIAREFKRRIGDPVPVIVGGTPFSAELLTARLLSWVIGVATEREGEAPDTITVSYPANWSRYKIDLLHQAFTIANLHDVRTCTEPEAAAITYATRARVPDSGHVAVYDLGGGTFDAALLRHAGARFEMAGRPEGIEHLGGVDFDEAVFQHVVRSLGPDLAEVDADDPATIRGLERLRRDCVLAKESLSTDTEARLSVTVGPLDTVVRLTRTEFEDMVRPALQETVAAMQRVLRSADVAPDALTAILLVGGSSRIPLVSEVLSAAFGRPLALDAHPKHEVATGAAWLSGPLPQPAARPAAQSAAQSVAPTGAPAAGATPDDVTAPTYPALAATAPTDVHTRPDAAAGRPARTGRGRWSGRRAWLAGAAAAVVGAVILAVVLLTGGNSGGGPAARKTTPATSPTPPSSERSKSAVDGAVSRPEGPPLADNVIQWTAARAGHTEIWAANSTGSGAHQLIPIEDAAGQVLSHDRKTIAYISDSVVFLIGTDGRGARPLFTSNASSCKVASRPAFNKDDTAVALLCEAAPNLRNLYVLDLAGRYLTKTPLVSGHIGDITFGARGQIAFWQACRGSEQKARLAMIAATAAPGTAPTALTLCVGANDPAFSPDGNSLAFTVWKGSDANVYVESLAGRKLQRLTTSKLPDQDPSWSPDGTQIAYKHGPSHDADIWVLTVADDRKHAITSDKVPDTVPSWYTR